MNSSAAAPAIPDRPGEALMPSDHTAANPVARLRKVNRDIAWLRWSAMAVWFVMFWWQSAGYNLRAAILVSIIGVAFSIFAHWFAHWRLRAPEAVRANAWLTMICDPILAAAMCLAAGGIDSVFMPFVYFTTLAAAFRFGTRETLGILALNCAQSVVLYRFDPGRAPGVDMLLSAMVYNCFAAVLGSIFAAWARDNLALAEAQSRALQAAHDRVRGLLHRLIDFKEVERKSIADDLHDRLGGRLFTLQQGIDRCALEVAPGSPLHAQLAVLARESRACADDVRVVMNELRPTLLDDLGLVETFGEYVANMTGVTSFRIDLSIDPALGAWRSTQDALLFRLVQEAVLNARKHAQAQRLSIELAAEEDAVVVTISDDGVGFDPAAIEPGHYGLLTMRERAEILGGTLRVTSTPGAGTVITVRLPR